MKQPTHKKQPVVPKALVKAAGLLLLVGTIGLTTCQTLVEARPDPATESVAEARPVVAEATGQSVPASGRVGGGQRR